MLRRVRSPILERVRFRCLARRLKRTFRLNSLPHYLLPGVRGVWRPTPPEGQPKLSLVWLRPFGFHRQFVTSPPREEQGGPAPAARCTGVPVDSAVAAECR